MESHARHVLCSLALVVPVGLAACATEPVDESEAPPPGKYDQPTGPAGSCEVLEASGIFDSFIPPARGETFEMNLDDPGNVSIEFANSHIGIPSSYERTPHHEGFRLSSPEHSTIIDVSISNGDPETTVVWISSDLATPAHNHFDHLVGRCR
jgi:hypothetical protein